MISCAACAHQNPDAQKFCGECGARLLDAAAVNISDMRALSYTPPHLAREVLTSRFALEGEHKLVTVMFCDIANSTPLAARVGAEAMHGLLNRFFELALTEVHRYEGTINQFLGDGFMALFGAPIAHEDHARRALLAASAINQHMRDAAGESGSLREVRLRMGLNTGMVVVGKIGDNLRMDYTAIGDATNLAARLQGFAEPGTICTSGSTRRAAAAHFEFKDLGKHPLRGVAEPVQIFEKLQISSASEPHSDQQLGGVGSVLVGREAELSVLSSSIDNLAQGHGSIVIICGEPGVGKSRLIAGAKSRAAAQDVLWLEGHSVSFGRSLSYWPFIEILKSSFGIAETDAEAVALSRLEAGVRALFAGGAGEIVPYLATVMSLPLSGDYKQRVEFLDSQAMKRQVFLSTRQLLEQSARRRPILIVVEDWHWVDQSSIALCEHLLPLTQSLPVTIWLSTRAEPAEPAARIRVTVSATPGLRLEEIEVSPLGTNHSRVLIDNLVGAVGLPETIRGQIERRTEGNPFFIEEVIRSLIADGTIVRDTRSGSWRLARPIADLVIPDTVQGLILARIDRLEESVKSVLKLASVIGRSFFLRILSAIVETADNVEQGLGTLEAAELVRVRQQLPELEYIFKHALVQEAAYGSILAERRRVIHRSVGRAIESLFADRQEEFASLLAYHYAHAEDWEKAQAYLMKAGDQAGRIAADAEALEHYRQAEARFMKVAGREMTPLQRAAMDRKLGQAYYGIGNYEQAVVQGTRALSHLGIYYPITRWGVRGIILRYLATHFLHRLIPGIRKPPFTRSIDITTAQEVSATCRLLAWLDFFADEERFGLDSLIELYAGERSGDVLARVRGLSTLALALSMFRAFALARRCAAEATAIAHGSNNAASTATAALTRGVLDAGSGPFDECRKSLSQSAAEFRRIGDIRGWGGPTCYLYWVDYWQGNLPGATSAAAELVEVGEAAGDPHVVCFGQNGLGMLAVTTGPLDKAAECLSKARDLSITITSYRFEVGIGGELAKCRLRQGRLSEAAAILETSIGQINSKGLRGMWTSDPLNAYAGLCLAIAERSQGAGRQKALSGARGWCRRALRCTRDALGWLPETQRLRGTLAWLSGKPGNANVHWKSSLATAERAGMPIERARTLLEMGARLGDTALVEEARRVFEQTGAKVDLAFSLHALASTVAAAGATALDAVRQHYDQAITALDAVKAEYDLGLALRDRAQLLTKLCRFDEAQADLVRAAQCLEAVGADTEKIS